VLIDSTIFMIHFMFSSRCEEAFKKIVNQPSQSIKIQKQICVFPIIICPSWRDAVILCVRRNNCDRTTQLGSPN
jgi:hypothetical protein